MTIARTNHYAAPPDCTTLDRTLHGDGVAVAQAAHVVKHRRLPRRRPQHRVGTPRGFGISDAIPEGADGARSADAYSARVVKHRRLPRRRLQHRVGALLGKGKSDDLLVGVYGDGVAVALAARVLKNGDVVPGVGPEGEARRDARAKAEGDRANAHRAVFPLI